MYDWTTLMTEGCRTRIAQASIWKTLYSASSNVQAFLRADEEAKCFFSDTTKAYTETDVLWSSDPVSLSSQNDIYNALKRPDLRYNFSAVTTGYSWPVTYPWDIKTYYKGLLKRLSLIGKDGFLPS